MSASTLMTSASSRTKSEPDRRFGCRGPILQCSIVEFRLSHLLVAAVSKPALPYPHVPNPPETDDLPSTPTGALPAVATTSGCSTVIRRSGKQLHRKRPQLSAKVSATFCRQLQLRSTPRLHHACSFPKRWAESLFCFPFGATHESCLPSIPASGEQKSLGTGDRNEARRLLAAKNEAARNP